jgi:hypothetical protein
MSAMRTVDTGWFCFEGRAYSRAPFSEINGKVLYANREPATKINVRLELAFGESPNNTATVAPGNFNCSGIIRFAESLR